MRFDRVSTTFTGVLFVFGILNSNISYSSERNIVSSAVHFKTITHALRTGPAFKISSAIEKVKSFKAIHFFSTHSGYLPSDAELLNEFVAIVVLERDSTDLTDRVGK